jgi:hypothetical protein
MVDSLFYTIHTGPERKGSSLSWTPSGYQDPDMAFMAALYPEKKDNSEERECCPPSNPEMMIQDRATFFAKIVMAIRARWESRIHENGEEITIMNWHEVCRCSWLVEI